VGIPVSENCEPHYCRQTQRRTQLKTQMEKRRAECTPRVGAKLGEKREACKAPAEANVAAHQLLPLVWASSERFQARAGIRQSRQLARAVKHAPLAACLASEQKPCSCSSRGCDSTACKAWTRSTPCSARLASWQTCSPRIAGAKERPQPELGIVAYTSSSLDSTNLGRASQGKLTLGHLSGNPCRLRRSMQHLLEV
jgi:hypothetical protein